MLRYVIRRLLLGVVAVLGATVIVFALSRMAGDPRYLFIGQSGYGATQAQWDAWGKEMGLDKPEVVQYFIWLGHVLRGDLGKSIAAQAPVTTLIRQTMSASAQLALGAWLFGTLVGVPLGVLSALKRGRLLDYAARVFALLGQSLPIFWTGLMAILVFAVILRWLPVGTKGQGLAVRNFILPSITLGWFPAAGYMRFTRSTMLEVLDSEYIKFARAKGVSGWTVIWKHAFKNASLVPLTYSALLLVGFVSGVVVTETIFSWPGMGTLAVNSIIQSDFPVLSAIVLIVAVLYVLVVLLLDILYAVLDPRIRYE